MSRPSHITRGNAFDDLGFSRSESSVLKLKAALLDAILDEVRRKRYGQHELVAILDEYQPNVTNLLHGKIAKVSIEKLLTYADMLGLKTKWTFGRRQRASAA